MSQSKGKKINLSPRPKKSSDADAWVELTELHDADAGDEKPRIKPKRLTVDIDPELHTRLKLHCVKNDQVISDFMRQLLVKALPDQ